MTVPPSAPPAPAASSSTPPVPAGPTPTAMTPAPASPLTVHADEREEMLDRLVAEYLDAVDRGTRPDRGAILAAHPDLAGDLSAFFADQDGMERVFSPFRADGSGSSRARPAGADTPVPPPGKPSTRSVPVLPSAPPAPLRVDSGSGSARSPQAPQAPGNPPDGAPAGFAAAQRPLHAGDDSGRPVRPPPPSPQAGPVVDAGSITVRRNGPPPSAVSAGTSSPEAPAPDADPSSERNRLPPRPERDPVSAKLEDFDDHADVPLPPPSETGDDDCPPERRLGDYELIDEIARGGMGVVWRARHRLLKRVVALKTVLPNRLHDAEDIRRFRAEAEAASCLEHPNIVPIYSVGVHRGRHYFTMRLIEGGSLKEKLERYHKDPVAAARMLAVVARAVHFAHRHSVLHRDLKPANILLEPDGTPQLTDFGLAKVLRPGGQDITRTGDVVGTPNYMAPEQAHGDAKLLTTAVDIWSLGAVLYAVLTGRPPFVADTPIETLHKLVHNEVEAPSLHRKDLDADLETICLKCLEKEPSARYGSAAELAEDLERWLAGEPIRARPTTRLERAVAWARRHPAWVAGAVAVPVLTVISIGLALWQWARAEGALEQARSTKLQIREQLDAVQTEVENLREQVGRLSAEKRVLADEVRRLRNSSPPGGGQ